MQIEKIKEKEYQKFVYQTLSNPSKIYTTHSGKRLQILSPGRHNVHEGPDFLEIAILLNGYVIVGDAEFHFKSSDWNSHQHHNDKKYDSVILHIVNNHDSDLNDFETLVLEEINTDKIENINDDNFEFTIDELQNYALIRLLRKTSEAQKIIKQSSLQNCIYSYTKEYLIRYAARRKRPNYDAIKLEEILKNILESKAAEFLRRLASGEDILVQDEMQTLLKSQIKDEGPNLRREILLNCILPISLCLANDTSRINLFLWYWSTPSLTKYGILSRKFANLPQNFLWQQQGMLEFMKEHGKIHNIVKEVLHQYGFAEILDFYQIGRSPFAGR